MNAPRRPDTSPDDTAPQRDAPQRLTALVSGRVQGVNYRAFVQTHARNLGLSGYAENLEGGRVEVVAEGPRAALDDLLLRLKQGPAHAEVSEVSTEYSEVTGLSGFHTY